MNVARRGLIVANWKMHKTAQEAADLAGAISLRVVDHCASVDVVLCPPFTSLQAVHSALENTPIALGAQNLHWETEGPFTGEISAAMILTSGCRYVILGHSERRQRCGESDEVVRRKLSAALKAGLEPIVCVGETLQQREAGNTNRVVLGQLESALEGVPSEDLVRISLAYEPVWAIGTGQTATAAQAEEVHAALRKWLRYEREEKIAQGIRIQYGGSVNPENAAELFAQENIDGGLIGGASLDADSFAAIVQAGIYQ
jgi:triosephosphate isomerase